MAKFGDLVSCVLKNLLYLKMYPVPCLTVRDVIDLVNHGMVKKMQKLEYLENET